MYRKNSMTTTVNFSEGTSTMDKHATATVGEELYLVHLQRLRGEEDDHDHSPRKRRSSSIGEELWEVHKRRSVSMDNDGDLDSETSNTEEKEPGCENLRPPPKKVLEASTCCRYHLRNRDVMTKKI